VSDKRCATHDARLANEAFFKCGCRYVSPPPKELPANPGQWLKQQLADLGLYAINAEEKAVLDWYKAFAAHGLHLVSAAEKAVLEAMAAATIVCSPADCEMTSDDETAVCRAELARREAKP
jgi:hypothetical protein